MRELGKFKKRIVLIFLCVFVMTASVLGLPTLFTDIIDYAIPIARGEVPAGLKMEMMEKAPLVPDKIEADFAPLVLYISIMLILVVGGLVCGIICAKLSVSVSMGVGKNLRSQLFEKVQYFSQAEIDEFSTSSLITRTNNDINQIQNFLTMCLSIALEAPIMFIVGVLLALYRDPWLSMIMLISLPIMVVVLIILGKIAVPLSTQIQKKIDRINMVMREKLTGVRVIRAFGTNDFEEKKFDVINRDYQKANKKMQNATNLLMPILVAVLSLTAAGIMLIAYLLSGPEGSYTIGTVMAIIQYVMMIMMAVIMLVIVFLLLPRAVTAGKRADEVLSTVPVIQNPEETKDDTSKKGYLEFRNVSFTYEGASKPAVHNLSFSAKPGETTAIIGGTGMGKSTIVNLIPRLYDVTEGEVLVDGVDVRDYDLNVLREKIGFVPQKAVMFSGTIESNLRFGDKNADEYRIEKAAEIAQASDFIMKKEEGFESPIAQGGTNVSGGQRQRLCIARAVVREPEIYVFDDSFSALDFKTDKALREALSAETHDATTVIVAQRVSTIMGADRIIVIEQGEIVGIGTHQELLESCDVYKEIVLSQMGEEAMKK